MRCVPGRHRQLLLPPSVLESTVLAWVGPGGEEVMGQDGGEGAAAAHRPIRSPSSAQWQGSRAAGVLPAELAGAEALSLWEHSWTWQRFLSPGGVRRSVVSFPSFSQADAHFLLFPCRLVSGFPSTTPILLLPLGS